MDWVLDYYTLQSRTFASGELTAAHRAIARRIHDWCADAVPGPRVLELAAGAGGVAVGLSELGYDVTAVELNPSDVALARALVERRGATVDVVHGDFYDIELPGRFDLVVYWDGFGIGSDADQRRLLARVAADWLAPEGLVVLDVFSPWRWRARAGETSERLALDGTPWRRTVGFDVVGQRIVDQWQPAEGGPVRTQWIRCYTLPGLALLLEGTGLAIRDVWLPDGTPLADVVDPDAALVGTNGYVALLHPEAG